MANFKQAYTHLLEREGNYHSGTIKGKTDAGGETYRGIARRYNPLWRGWAVIDKIKAQQKIAYNAPIPEVNDSAYKYTKEKYWDTLFLDVVKSQDVAEIIFEINWGFPSKVVTEIKKALAISNTLAPSALVSKINAANYIQLYRRLAEAYAQLLRGSSEYSKFKTGYENRISYWLKKKDEQLQEPELS